MPDTEKLAQAVLDLPLLPSNDADAATVREYLAVLLDRLWEEGEGFSGKRPLGNSGWKYDIYVPLARAGYIHGTFDEDGDAVDLDCDEGARLVRAAIAALS